MPSLYPIDYVPTGKLAILARPRGGDWLADDIAAWKHAQLNLVITLLEDDEMAELELLREAALCQQMGLQFLRFPIPDRGVPAHLDDMKRIVTVTLDALRAGRSVGIHCRSGVGRSPLVAACILAAMGVSLEQGWADIRLARGLSVPDTAGQTAWAVRWADSANASPDDRTGPRGPTGSNI